MGKRRGDAGCGDASASTNKRRKVDATPKKAFKVDELDWQPVTLPDFLDDAEGFYGLEEIGGVEIVRDAEHGEVKFQAHESKGRKTPAADDDDYGADVLFDVSDEDDDGEEWGGFPDDGNDKPEPTSRGGKDAVKPVIAQTDIEDVDLIEATRFEGSQVEARSDKDEEKKEQKLNKKQDKAQEFKKKERKVQNGTGIQGSISFAALEDANDTEGVDISAWDTLNLNPEIQISLSKLGFSAPTPIQSACIPPIIAGRDIIGKASTGSGKTLAFGIPIIQHYLKLGRNAAQANTKSPYPIAVILSPTRELAHQISNHISELSARAPSVNLKIALLTGGLSVQKQQRLLRDADIVIGTPGRTWDVINNGQGLVSKLRKVKFLVIDEADRLLSEGHFKEVGDILGAINRYDDEGESEGGDGVNGTDDVAIDKAEANRQTLVFSATFHKGLQQKLAGKGKSLGGDLLNQQESMEYLLKKLQFREEKPMFVDVNPVSQMAENLKEGILECPAMEKDLYLYTLLLYHPKQRTLVFTNSISAVRRLTSLLTNLNVPALALHSNMAQKARLRSVERFSSPSPDPSSVLIATDVAARGLDIKGVDMVVHYHVPRTADAYVHRSGRTARASTSGKSILLCAPEEIVGVARLAAKIHSNAVKSGAASSKKIPMQTVDLDRRVVSRVKPRISLAQKLTEFAMAKEKLSHEDDWLRNAAEELGVDYDSDEFEKESSRARGRGGGRQNKQKQAGSLAKAEVAGLRAQLRDLLSKKINVGVSEKYLTAGRVDIEALLKGEGSTAFLGHVDKLDF
ncbi:ATP-dependent RNA helicase [Ascosphaera aggregata]|nr:ATP-dependent RNA helicase [Ascosphaera aggregata]